MKLLQNVLFFFIYPPLELFCCHLLLRNINDIGLVLRTLLKCDFWRYKIWPKKVFSLFSINGAKIDRWFRKPPTTGGQINCILKVLLEPPYCLKRQIFFLSTKVKQILKLNRQYV